MERDNQLLLEKMSHIMRTNGQVDNTNDYRHRRYANNGLMFTNTASIYEFSLNKTRRQRDLLRVTHENQAILKRIQSKEPHYNHLQWLDQWHVNREYMSNISKYPHTWITQDKVIYLQIILYKKYLLIHCIISG